MSNILGIEDPAPGFYIMGIIKFETGQQVIKKTKYR